VIGSPARHSAGRPLVPPCERCWSAVVCVLCPDVVGVASPAHTSYKHLRTYIQHSHYSDAAGDDRDESPGARLHASPPRPETGRDARTVRHASGSDPRSGRPTHYRTSRAAPCTHDDADGNASGRPVGAPPRTFDRRLLPLPFRQGTSARSQHVHVAAGHSAGPADAGAKPRDDGLRVIVPASPAQRGWGPITARASVQSRTSRAGRIARPRRARAPPPTGRRKKTDDGYTVRRRIGCTHSSHSSGDDGAPSTAGPAATHAPRREPRSRVRRPARAVRPRRARSRPVRACYGRVTRSLFGGASRNPSDRPSAVRSRARTCAIPSVRRTPHRNATTTTAARGPRTRRLSSADIPACACACARAARRRPSVSKKKKKLYYYNKINNNNNAKTNRGRPRAVRGPSGPGRAAAKLRHEFPG